MQFPENKRVSLRDMREERHYGLIGYPAEGSFSPRLFAAAYHGRYSYSFIEEKDFAEVWKRFTEGKFHAVNVTAPHKKAAAEAASWRSPEVISTEAANILVKSSSGEILAYNSDTLAVRALCEPFANQASNAAVVGFGGAGRAAAAALESLGLKPEIRHHDTLGEYLTADIVICTLPQAVPGLENIRCKWLIEANYRNPLCRDIPEPGHYIGGLDWLKAQAALGYGLMTGESPDTEAIMSCELKTY